MSRAKSKHSFAATLTRWGMKLLVVAVVGLLLYSLAAYFVVPRIWRHVESKRVLDDSPKVTRTAEGIAGDPVNVAFVGTQMELMRALLAAGWQPSDPKTLESGLRLAEAVLQHRSYSNAPVSDLYLWGRRQDLAFEQQVGDSPAERHHVRLWNAGLLPLAKRQLWLGSATFDKSVGISHETGKITHHIAADLDAERAKLFADLADSGRIESEFVADGLGATVHGRNAGGDAYFTDGRIRVGILKTRDEAPPFSSVEVRTNAQMPANNR